MLQIPHLAERGKESQRGCMIFSKFTYWLLAERGWCVHRNVCIFACVGSATSGYWKLQALWKPRTLIWKTVPSMCPTWVALILKAIEMVHIGHSGGEPAFVLPRSVFRANVTDEAGLQRGEKGEGRPLCISHWASYQLWHMPLFLPNTGSEYKKVWSHWLIKHFWSPKRTGLLLEQHLTHPCFLPWIP